MPFAPHIRVQAIGSLGNPEVDRFSYGWCMSPPEGLTLPVDSFLPGFSQEEDIHAFFADCKDSVVAFHGRAATKIGTYCHLDTVKFAAIKADGTYQGNAVVFQVDQNGGGGNMGGSLPQSAVAVTLDTGIRGPSYRGRFFIPYPSVDTSGAQGFHIPQGVAEGIRDSARTLIVDLNEAPGLDFTLDSEVVVASTKGFNTKVTSVRVGRVVDTIRSRRNKIPELYTDPVSV